MSSQKSKFQCHRDHLFGQLTWSKAPSVGAFWSRTFCHGWEAGKLTVGRFPPISGRTLLLPQQKTYRKTVTPGICKYVGRLPHVLQYMCWAHTSFTQKKLCDMLSLLCGLSTYWETSATDYRAVQKSATATVLKYISCFTVQACVWQ